MGLNCALALAMDKKSLIMALAIIIMSEGPYMGAAIVALPTIIMALISITFQQAIPEATRANAEAIEAMGAPKSNQYQRRSAQVVAKRECSSGHQTSGNQGQRRSDQVVAKRECPNGHKRRNAPVVTKP